MMTLPAPLYSMAKTACACRSTAAPLPTPLPNQHVHALGHPADTGRFRCRKLERAHAAIFGDHSRHSQLLPLEFYLEEGIPLVLHVRDGPNMQLVELPEQSCHAFLTFGNVESPLPALKVGLIIAFTPGGAGGVLVAHFLVGSYVGRPQEEACTSSSAELPCIADLLGGGGGSAISKGGSVYQAHTSVEVFAGRPQQKA